MKIAVVSPHRDDAAFSLGLAIEAWLAEMHTLVVVNCFTRSEYAPYAEFEMLHANDRMPRVSALRLREDEAWQKMYGRGLELRDLHLKDAPQRLRVAPEEVLGRAVNPDDKAMAKVSRALRLLAPDALVLPLALGGHVDHATAQWAALRAELPEGLPTAFYEDLPYAAWPGVAESIEGAAKGLDRGLRPRFVTASGADSKEAARKRRLALCYDSQISDSVADDMAAFCLRYGGRERLWVNAAWCDDGGLHGIEA